ESSGLNASAHAKLQKKTGIEVRSKRSKGEKVTGHSPSGCRKDSQGVRRLLGGCRCTARSCRPAERPLAGCPPGDPRTPTRAATHVQGVPGCLSRPAGEVRMSFQIIASAVS